MSRLCFRLPMLCFFLVAPSFGQEPKNKKGSIAEWSVQSLQIDKRSQVPELGPFGNGTRVTVRLHMPDRLIVGIDTKKSTIETFTDDRRTNLLEKPLRFKEWNVVDNASILKDGRAARLELQAGGIPTAGASRIIIKGKVTAIIATNEKAIEKKDLVFFRGVDLPIGTLKLMGFSNSVLEYIGSRPLKSAVIELESKTIPLTVITTKALSKGGASSEFRAALQPPPFEKAALTRGSIRIIYYDTIEQVVVPFDLSIGVGL